MKIQIVLFAVAVSGILAAPATDDESKPKRLVCARLAPSSITVQPDQDSHVQASSRSRIANDNVPRPSPFNFQHSPYHRLNFDNTGDAEQIGYGNLNVGRRHNNVQKGVQQNGVGNKNIQKDEFNWRRGKVHTSDVQENVKQNGIGKMNDKSLRRINELMRSIFNDDENDKKHEDKRRRWQGHRRNNKKNQPSRRDDDIKVRQNASSSTPSDLESPTQTPITDMDEKVSALRSMLCKTISSMCNKDSIPSRRGMNQITQDNITQIGHRNVNSQMSVIQNSSPSKNDRKKPTIIDEYDEVIFLPNYEVKLQ